MEGVAFLVLAGDGGFWSAKYRGGFQATDGQVDEAIGGEGFGGV